MLYRTRFLPCFAALVLPLLVQAVWLSYNTQLPRADATGALTQTYELFRLAAKHEWQALITGLYTLRDSRPTSLSIFEFPFMLLAGGNLMATMAAMTLASTCVSVTYIYLLLRLSLGHWRAALGAALLGLMPVIQWPACSFGFTEAPFMATMLAAFYHLLRTDDFNNPRQTTYMSITTALAFTLRPVEAFLHFVPVYAWCVYRAWRSQALAGAQIALMIFTACCFASILIIAGWWPHGLFVFPISDIFTEPRRGSIYMVTSGLVFILTFVCGAHVVRKMRDTGWRRAAFARPPYLVPATAGLCLAITLFFLGFMTELVIWTYLTSLGELSTVVAPLPADVKFAGFALGVGLLPLVGLSVFACTAPHARSPLMPLLALMPLAIIMPLISCQYSQRKMTIALACLCVVLASLALRQGTLSRLRTTSLLLIMMWQGAGDLWIGTANPHTALLEYTIGARKAFPEMVSIRPNPHDTVVDFVIATAKQHGLKHVSLPLLGGGALDPFLLHMLAAMRTKDVSLFFPYFSLYNPAMPDHLYDVAGGDGFLLAPDRKPEHTAMEVARLRGLGEMSYLPTDKLAYELLARYAEGTLEKSGAHLLNCITPTGTDVPICLFAYNR